MKKKIALVTGGLSGESVISYQSAKNIFNAIDKTKFDVFTIDINPEGWFFTAEDEKIAVNKNDFSFVRNGEKVTFDAVYIGMHGTPGEDGKLQGYFDMLKIPYTSCDAATSALTFNKRYTTAVAAMSGIRVARSVLFIKDRMTNADQLVKELRFPVFVKPNNGGSSIGMSRVNAPTEELGSAIEKAFREDNQVLVEEMIPGREFTIGVYRAAGQIHVLPITEVKSHKEFFDFEAKYQGKSTETTPAQITNVWKEKLQDRARRVYEVFNCSGVVRIDFIYNEAEDEPYMLEINTIPGQTDASVVPQQVRAGGGDLTEFYSQLIEASLENR